MLPQFIGFSFEYFDYFDTVLLGGRNGISRPKGHKNAL
ncbi:conserved hypothetical protein (plasmid) [Borreliella finlandensis]|uniref:Uncharacterized protein n=1 Tax=Borreliella finlandensis TaxID=498741 RepID=A0A806C707_9SPIR|nr:conserved hypothetical protein [Borreliella finlandensis]